VAKSQLYLFQLPQASGQFPVSGRPVDVRISWVKTAR